MSQLSLRTAEVIAIEINSIREQTQRILLCNSIEIGRRLSEAKSMLPHGEWGNWLADSVDYSQSTAGNLMKIFESYGSDQLSLFGDNSNSEALTNLNYTQAVALLGVPEEEREKFVVDNKVEEISTRELKESIKAHKQAVKEKEAAEKAVLEATKREEKERKLREKLELQQADHARIVEKMQSQIDASASVINSEVDTDVELQESLERSEADLADSLAKIKQLEKELKAKPIDIPVTVEIEKVPIEIEKELEELRKKVAQGTGEEAAVFKAHFKSLTDSFANVLSALEVVGKSDTDLQEKYKSAVSKLIGRMSEEL